MTQKEKIKHERVLKLKKIGFWTLNIVSYILAGLFLIVLIISLSTPKKQNVSPRGVNNLYNEQITEVIREDSPNNVVYDDESYSITLSTDELNNYTWDNLATYLNNTGAPNNFSLVYNNVNYSYIDTDEGAYQYVNNQDYIYFVIEYSTFNDAYGGHFVNYQFALEQNTFEYSVSITTNQTYYNAIKTAIELDIVANELNETQTIFESISQVLTNFITTLNSGITSVLNLFWNSTTSQLTLLGNLSTIVIGVAVCFFLFRLVIGLIRLRG